MIDRATVFGLLASVGLLAAVMLAGAGYAVGVYWQTSSLLLVLGGSLLATLVAYPGNQFRMLVPVLGRALQAPAEGIEERIARLVRLAEIARREGMLALEGPVSTLPDGFMQRAMRMAIDGADGATIESVMRAEMEATDLRHTYGKGLLETIARFAPVFGMIGTVIGLVVMLGNMSDPGRIGPGMATALLTTLYGLVLANVLCLPLARKLAHRSSQELLEKTIILRGVLAIQAGDHPRVVQQKLVAYLPSGGERREAVRAAAVEPVVQETAEGQAAGAEREAA